MTFGTFFFATKAQSGMKSLTQAQIKLRLELLKEEHSKLDSSIRSLQNQPNFDQIRIQRLKKRKLALKDEIAALENQIIPDIIA